MISESSGRLRERIEKAIENHKITHEEYEEILHIAMEDAHIDHFERIHLQQLQEMIANGMVKWDQS